MLHDPGSALRWLSPITRPTRSNQVNSYRCSRISNRRRCPSALYTHQIVSCRSNCAPFWTSRCRAFGNVRFAETGWWCAQSYANRSPCYLANIRVIFENNSEPAAKSVKKNCGTGISLILRQFDIREEQGAHNCRNTERAFDELGGGKRTHSDQESGPTSYGP